VCRSSCSSHRSHLMRWGTSPNNNGSSSYRKRRLRSDVKRYSSTNVPTIWLRRTQHQTLTEKISLKMHFHWFQAILSVALKWSHHSNDWLLDICLLDSLISLFNRKVYYRDHKRRPLNPTLIQPNAVRPIHPYLTKLHFTVTLPPTSKSSLWSLIFRSPNQTL
jgi:hypothetical protein